MADVVVHMSGDEARLLASLEKVAAKEAQVRAGFTKTKEAARQTGEAGQRAGQQMSRGMGQAGTSTNMVTSALGSMATRLIAIAGPLMLIQKGFALMREDAEKAGQAVEQSEAGMSKLAQLAKTPAEFRKLTEAARETFREGGAPTLGAAAEQIFALQSAGALEQRKLFSQLGATGLVGDVAGMAKSAKTLIESMGVRETGGFRPLVSKAFGVSEFSPATAEAIMEAASRAGAGAAELKFSDEEVLAATAALSAAVGSAEEAGTQIASLMRAALKKPELRKETLRETISALAKEKPEELFEEVGRAEAMNAVLVLNKNLQTFDAAVRAATEAEREDRVTQQLRLAETDPAIRAARLKRINVAQEALAAEERGIDKATTDAIIAARKADLEEAGKNVQATLGAQAVGALRFVVGSKATAEMFSARNRAEAFRRAGLPVPPEIAAKLPPPIEVEEHRVKEPDTGRDTGRTIRMRRNPRFERLTIEAQQAIDARRSVATGRQETILPAAAAAFAPESFGGQASSDWPRLIEEQRAAAQEQRQAAAELQGAAASLSRAVAPARPDFSGAQRRERQQAVGVE